MPLSYSYKDLISGKTAAAIFADLLTRLKGYSLPTDDWNSDAPQRVILEQGFSGSESAIWTAAATMAKGVLLRKAQEMAEEDIANWELGAPDTWLYVLAQNLFFVEPFPAEFTQGTIRFINTSATPRTLTPAHVVSTSGGLRYTLLGTTALAAGATVYVAAKAEQAGSKYNVGPGSITQLNVSLPGVTVSNQPDPAAGAASWITTSGSDRERPKELADRCAFRWGRLSQLQNAPADAYKSLARDSAKQVKKVAVWSNYSHATGAFRANVVTLYLGGDTAPVDAAVAAAVKILMAPYIGLHDALEVQPCGTSTWTLSGTVFARDASLIPSVRAAVEEKIVLYQQELDIGERGYVWRIQDLMGVPGVKNFTTTMGDNQPAKNALIAINYSGLVYAVAP